MMNITIWKRVQAWSVSLALVCVAAASSCGGGGGGSCGAVSPCGGDPTGTWKFSGACANTLSGFDTSDFCPTATMSVGGLGATGTVAFNADMTYTVALTQTGSLNMNIPATCLMESGMTLTCAQLQQGIQAAIAQDPTAPFSGITCSGSSSCSCTFTISSTTNDTGTWAVSGTNLSLTGAMGPDMGPFCVKDKELHLISVDTTMTMGTMGQAKIVSDIVATKQ